MTKQKTKTAAEFITELNANPDYMARLRLQEETSRRRKAEFQALERPLLHQLKAAGYPLQSLDLLVQTYAPLPSPIVTLLLEWITQVTDVRFLEQIVRALGAARVSFDGRVLVNLFEKTDSESLHWAIANTLSLVPAQGVGAWVIEAVQNPAYGTARQMLALAVAQHNSAAVANPVLVGLLGDLPGHAALALAQTGGQHELEILERLYGTTKGWVHKEIGRAVSVISRRLQESTQ